MSFRLRPVRTTGNWANKSIPQTGVRQTSSSQRRTHTHACTHSHTHTYITHASIHAYTRRAVEMPSPAAGYAQLNGHSGRQSKRLKDRADCLLASNGHDERHSRHIGQQQQQQEQQEQQEQE